MAYCTVTDVLRRFGKKESSLPAGWGIDVADIQSFIDKNEIQIDDIYNGTFELTTYTDEYLDAPGKDNELIVRHRPIASITSLFRKVGTTSWTQLVDATASQDITVDGFILRDSSAGIIKLCYSYEYPGQSYGGEYSSYDDMYKITYAAGFAVAPDWVKEICIAMTQLDILLVLRHNGTTENVDMLNAYRDTYKMLKDTVEEGKKRIRRHRRPGVGVL
jgi:hypothetical protein